MDQEPAAITDAPVFPPGFQVYPCVGSPWDSAVRAAEADAEAASVFWNGSEGWCRAAVVLAPDHPVASEALVELGLLAVFDALAVLSPPQMPLHVRRSDASVVVDGAKAAWVRAEQGQGWAVLGFGVALRGEDAAPGAAPERTWLAEEGFGEIGAGEMLAHVCRHLLGWVDVWLDGGAAPLSRAVGQREARRAAA